MSILNTENAKIAVQVDCMLARMRAESRAILEMRPEASQEWGFDEVAKSGSHPYVESIFRQFVASVPEFSGRSRELDEVSDALVRIAIDSRANEPDFRQNPKVGAFRYVASFSLRGETNPRSSSSFDAYLIQSFGLRKINISANRDLDAICEVLKIQRAIDKYIKAKEATIGAKHEDRIFTRPALHLYRVTIGENGKEIWDFIHY